jgi:hypothetical protein
MTKYKIQKGFQKSGRSSRRHSLTIIQLQSAAGISSSMIEMASNSKSNVGMLAMWGTLSYFDARGSAWEFHSIAISAEHSDVLLDQCFILQL